MIYPQKLNSKKGEIILNIFIIFSIILAASLILINKLTTPQVPWAAIANCGIIYVWITLFYTIKKGTNIAGHVLLQTIIMSMAALYIDSIIGFKEWSINIAVPIILMLANIIMFIVTIISHRDYIKYAICQLLIVIISIGTFILISKENIEFKVLINIANGISILNLLVSLCLCYKDIKEAIIRKIHM